jgi:hypothetical protein
MSPALLILEKNVALLAILVFALQVVLVSSYVTQKVPAERRTPFRADSAAANSREVPSRRASNIRDADGR